MRKNRVICLFISLFVVFSGMWYSSYTKKKFVMFDHNDIEYYNGVKTEKDFNEMLKSESIVNINTAEADELDKLYGIGPKTAQSIIAYREENGGFGSKEEIMNVSGIGEATYSKIKDYISVEGENWNGL